MEMTRKNVSPSGLMTLDDAATYLGIKVSAVKRLRRSKRLPFVKLSGKLMVRQQWIDEFLEREKDI